MIKINLVLIIMIVLLIIYHCYNLSIESFNNNLKSLNLEQDGTINHNNNGTFSIDPDLVLNPEDSITFIKKFTKNISIYRPVGSKELNYVKKQITDEMKKIGLEIEIQSFTRKINNKDYLN